MKLLTQENRKRLPAIHSQEDKGGDAVAQVKFFTLDAAWTWYATQFDGEDTFFGFEMELGYFSLSELQGVRGPLGLGIERDRYFTPVPLKEIAPKLFEEDSQ